MVLDARKERERLERAEAVKVERVLVDVLDATELTQVGHEHEHNYETGCRDTWTTERRPGCDLAPELLDKLAAQGYRLVKIDPFEPVRVGPASFAQTSTTNPAPLIKSGRVVPIDPADIASRVVDLARRVEEIARWLDREDEGWRHGHRDSGSWSEVESAWWDR